MYPNSSYFNSNVMVPSDLATTEYEYYGVEHPPNHPDPGWKGGNMVNSHDFVSPYGHSELMYSEGHGGGPQSSHSYLPLRKHLNNTPPNIASEYEPSFRTPETYTSMHSPLLSKEETYEYPHPVSSFFSDPWNGPSMSSSVPSDVTEPTCTPAPCQVSGGGHGHGVYKLGSDVNSSYAQQAMPSIPRAHMEVTRYIPPTSSSIPPNGSSVVNQVISPSYPPYGWRSLQSSPMYLQLVNQSSSANAPTTSYPYYSLYPPYPNPVVGYNMMNVSTSPAPSGQNTLPSSSNFPNPSPASSSSSSSNISSSMPASSSSSSSSSSSAAVSSQEYESTSPVPVPDFSSPKSLLAQANAAYPLQRADLSNNSSLPSGALNSMKAPKRKRRLLEQPKQALEQTSTENHMTTSTKRPKKRKSSKIPLFIPNLGPVSDYATANKCGDGVIFTCKTCAKTFNQIYNLKSHLRTHSNERPYQCPICQKPFLRKADMLRHTKIHNRPNRHKCTKCNIFFPNLPSYRMHIESSRACGEGFNPPEWVSYST